MGKKKCKPTGVYKKELKHRLTNGAVTKPCHYCGVPLSANTMTLDHIQPLSRRGSNHHTNFVVACKRCNGEKGSMPYEVFKALKLPEKQARKNV